MIKMERPEIKCVEVDVDEYYARFEVEPLEKGYGITLGNSLRRILLSSLPGFAINRIKIDGASHEFVSLPGISEDVTDLILNLKQICLKPQDINDEEDKKLSIKAVGPCVITGKDIITDGSLSVVNSDCHIAYVEEGHSLNVEMNATKGRGYSVADKSQVESLTELAIDAIFTPVKKANFKVEKTRVGASTDYDKLTLEIWTNGVIEPYESLSLAAKILDEHLVMFTDLSDIAENMSIMAKKESTKRDQLLDKSIDDLGFSVRSYNCLKRSGMQTVSDIVDKTEHEMIKVRNLGKKSLEEVINKIKELGLEFKKED